MTCVRAHSHQEGLRLEPVSLAPAWAPVPEAGCWPPVPLLVPCPQMGCAGVPTAAGLSHAPGDTRVVRGSTLSLASVAPASGFVPLAELEDVREGPDVGLNCPSLPV